MPILIIGQLNQEQFIEGVQNCLPRDQLERFLHFEIIPLNVLSEVNHMPPLQSPSFNDNSHTGAISDNQLRQLADQLARRHWESFALRLDFLEYDIEAVKVQHRSEPRATVCYIEHFLYFGNAHAALHAGL
jgi:hypothetical protein